MKRKRKKKAKQEEQQRIRAILEASLRGWNEELNFRLLCDLEPEFYLEDDRILWVEELTITNMEFSGRKKATLWERILAALGRLRRSVTI
ncbi:MAG: hypothetical protein LBQ15_05070 [Clostridium sp.]|jgi:hypothetical protein|nr:hypothetical protein [Clostridium sp.]